MIGDGGSPSPERGDAALERIGLARRQVEEVHTDLMRRLETSTIFLELIEAQP